MIYTDRSIFCSDFNLLEKLAEKELIKLQKMDKYNKLTILTLNALI